MIIYIYIYNIDREDESDVDDSDREDSQIDETDTDSADFGESARNVHSI